MIFPLESEMESRILEAEQFIDLLSDLLNRNTKDAFMQLCEIMGEEKALSIGAGDQRVYILGIIAAYVVRIELKHDVSNCFFSNRNMDEIVRLYKKVVMLLRRVEMDFEYEYQYEIIDFLVKEKISMIALLGIIKGTVSIIQKDKVKQRVYNLLQMGNAYE